MRIMLGAAALAVFAASSAHADDIGFNGPFTSWTGGYVGLSAGGGWSNGTPSDNTYHLRGEDGTFGNGWFGAEGSKEDGSLVGGIQTGYNYQAGNFVFGIEGDFHLSKVKSQYSATTDESLYAEPNYEYHLEEDLHTSSTVQWFGTLRPRIGYLPQERLMVYATGGLAFGSVKSSGGYNWREHGFWWGGPGDHFFDRTGGFDDSSSDVRAGWTLGGGLEYALSQHLSLKAEYLFVDLGGKNHISYSTDEEGEYAIWKDHPKFSTLQFGINYKF